MTGKEYIFFITLVVKNTVVGLSNNNKKQNKNINKNLKIKRYKFFYKNLVYKKNIYL